jgi:hypothetical protein
MFSGVAYDRVSEEDLKKADPASLDYSMFLGDITLKQNKVDFSTQWRWVPILDFATYFWAAVESLDKQPVAHYDFTESEAKLTLRKIHSKIHITASYAEGTITAEHTELRQEAKKFFQSVVDDLIKNYPDLAENQWFMERAAMARSR